MARNRIKKLISKQIQILPLLQHNSVDEDMVTRGNEATRFMAIVGLKIDHPIMTTLHFWTYQECLLFPGINREYLQGLKVNLKNLRKNEFMEQNSITEVTFMNRSSLLISNHSEREVEDRKRDFHGGHRFRGLIASSYGLFKFVAFNHMFLRFDYCSTQPKSYQHQH